MTWIMMQKQQIHCLVSAQLFPPIQIQTLSEKLILPSHKDVLALPNEQCLTSLFNGTL